MDRFHKIQQLGVFFTEERKFEENDALMNDTIFVLDSNKCPPPAKISLKISVNSLFKKFCLSLGKEVQIWRVSNLMKTYFRNLLKLFQNKI